MLKITQQDLADFSGISLRTIIAIEDNSGNPSLSTLSRIADVLGLEVQLVLRGLCIGCFADVAQKARGLSIGLPVPVLYQYAGETGGCIRKQMKNSRKNGRAYWFSWNRKKHFKRVIRK